MQMTQEKYEQRRSVGQMFQATQRETDRRQKIDIIEREKDRKLQYGILLASGISAIAAILAAIFSYLR